MSRRQQIFIIKYFTLLWDSSPVLYVILLFSAKGENLFSVLEIFLVPPIIVGVGKRERWREGENTNYTHIGIVMTNISFPAYILPDTVGVAGVGGAYNWLLCFILLS